MSVEIQDGEKCTSGKNGFAGDFIYYVSNWSAHQQRHLSFTFIWFQFSCIARFAYFVIARKLDFFLPISSIVHKMQ